MSTEQIKRIKTNELCECGGDIVEEYYEYGSTILYCEECGRI